jgi:LemA protein
MIIGIILLILIILAVVGIIFMYNNLVGLRNRVKNAWSQIDVQLNRRADLIPNLVETVKGYAKHEKGVFEEVTKARSSIMNAQTVQESAEANNMLTGALKSLFAVAENYPELKANQNFRDLQSQLAETEDK